MKIFCLEGHITTPAIIESWQDLDPATRDLAIGMSTGNDKERHLLDLGEQRIRANGRRGDRRFGPLSHDAGRAGPSSGLGRAARARGRTT